MKVLILISLLLIAVIICASQPQFELEYLTTRKGLRLVRLIKLVNYPLYCFVRNGDHTSNFTVHTETSRWYRVYSSDVEIKCSEYKR